MTVPRSTILAIDDTEEVRRLLEEKLRQSHLVKTAPDGGAALALARQPPLPDLVLLDTRLAAESGYDLCKALRALPGLADVPVIFLAERRDAQDLAQAFRLDAIDFLVKPLSAPTIGAGIEARLEQIARERSAQLKGSERRVARLLRAMQWHDSSLGDKRTRRLAEYARALGEAAGAREAARELLMRAAQLHDVGKLGVPAELLRRERTLSGAERALLERHAALGAEIIGEHDDALLKLARTIALTHHERWDGAGYPARLQANQIPWSGRVMAIVDAFESMTAPQHGGSAISVERAVAEIGAAGGKQFDPALVEALRKAVPAFRQVYKAHSQQPAEDDFVIGEAADSTRRLAAPADDDFVIGAAAEGARRAPEPVDDDLVIGAAAAGAVDKPELTMIGPLPTRGESGSTNSNSLGEAAIPPAEAPAAAELPAPARRPAEPVDDDLVIGAAAAGRSPKHEAIPPAEAPAPAQLPAPLVKELESGKDAAAERDRAEQAQLQAQIKSLSARVNELEAERGTTQAALAQANAERAAAVAALSQAQGEVARLGQEREVAEERHRREQSELHGQLAGLRAGVKELEGERGITQAPLAQAKADLDGTRARVTELETERAAAVAALSQAQGELARLGREREAAEERHRREQSELHAQLAGLRADVKELEGERGITQAALAQAKVALDQVRARMNELQSELPRLGEGHAAAEERHRQEQARLQEQLDTLRARLKKVEGERPAAEQRHDAENALAELDSRRRAAEAALAAEREHLRIVAEREAAELAATEAANRRQEAEERLSIIPAAPTAAAAGATAKSAQGPQALVLLVVFLLGGLAVAITFILALYYIQAA